MAGLFSSPRLPAVAEAESVPTGGETEVQEAALKERKLQRLRRPS